MRIMSTMTTDRGSLHNIILVQSHLSGSAAEQTIATHSNPEAIVNDIPLVIEKTALVIQRTQLMVTLVVGVMVSGVVYLVDLISTGSHPVLQGTIPKINLSFGKNFGLTSQPLRRGRVSLYISIFSIPILSVALTLTRLLILFKPILRIIQK